MVKIKDIFEKNYDLITIISITLLSSIIGLFYNLTSFLTNFPCFVTGLGNFGVKFSFYSIHSIGGILQKLFEKMFSSSNAYVVTLVVEYLIISLLIIGIYYFGKRLFFSVRNQNIKTTIRILSYLYWLIFIS